MNLGDRLKRTAAERQARRSVPLSHASALSASWHIWETELKHAEGFALRCLSQNAVANSDDVAKCWSSLQCLRDKSHRQ